MKYVENGIKNVIKLGLFKFWFSWDLGSQFVNRKVYFFYFFVCLKLKDNSKMFLFVFVIKEFLQFQKIRQEKKINIY